MPLRPGGLAEGTQAAAKKSDVSRAQHSEGARPVGRTRDPLPMKIPESLLTAHDLPTKMFVIATHGKI